MSGCQLDGLAEHHAESDATDAQLVGYAQRLADIIAILHECLPGQLRIAVADEPLALAAAVDHHAVGAAGLGYGHTLAYGVDEGFLAEGFHDPRDADDADASLDAQAGIERATRHLCTLRHADRHLQCCAEGLQIAADHHAGDLIDGRRARRIVESRQRDDAHAFAAENLNRLPFI